MDWILQCLLWVTLTSTSAYRCKQHGGFFDYPHYHDYDSQETSPPQVRRIDFANYQPPPPYTRRFEQANYDNHAMNERSAERTNERPTQRMNERSIAVNSGVQRVQEHERRRLQSRVEEGIPRIENGSYKIVNTYPKTYPSVTNRRGQLENERPDRIRDSGSVVFPGPTSKSSQEYVPDIPEECIKTGICENVPNYPTELAASIIAQLGEKRDRFHIDELDEPEIAQRIGPAEQNIELCLFREKIVMPDAAPDKNGNWYFILNEKNKPLQGYRVEICERGGAACNQNVAYFRSGYTATCRQKYVQRTMTAIDRTGNVKYDLPFKVPSCCSCVATHTDRK